MTAAILISIMIGLIVGYYTNKIYRKLRRQYRRRVRCPHDNVMPLTVGRSAVHVGICVDCWRVMADPKLINK